MPPASKVAEARDRTRLASWSGRPLESRNVGAFFEASTLVCRLAEPGKLEAMLAVDQNEIDFAQAGQAVDLLLSSHPGEQIAGQIAHIAEANMEAASNRLAAKSGGQLATQSGADGLERPLSVVYQASVPLDDPFNRLFPGLAGTARIHAGYQSLGHGSM